MRESQTDKETPMAFDIPPPSNKLRLVVIGNGMAAMRTVEELLKLVPDLYEITVFGAEPHPNYNRILLSPVLAGINPSRVKPFFQARASRACCAHARWRTHV